MLAALLPHELMGDDFARFTDIERLLHHGELSDSRNSLVMPLISAPVLLVGEVVRTPEWWAAHFNLLVVGLGALLIWWLLRDRLDRTTLRRTLLVLLFASFLTNRLRDYGAEVLTATLVTIALVLLTYVRRPVLGWGAIVVGVVNTPAALVGAALLALSEAVRTKRLRHLLVPVIAAALIMLEAWIRRGGPLTTGYEHDHGARTLLPYSGREGLQLPVRPRRARDPLLLRARPALLHARARLLVHLARPEAGHRVDAAVRRRARDRVCEMVGVARRALVGAALLRLRRRAVVVADRPAAAPGRSFGGGRRRNAARARALGLGRRERRNRRPLDAELLRRRPRRARAPLLVHGEYSSLWHPLVQFPALTWKTALLAAYCALVFAYLAAPLAASLLRRLPGREWAAGWRL